MNLKTIFLILGSIGFILITGAALYEHIAVVPGWSAAPPKSLAMFQGEYGLNPAPFWMMIHPVTMLLLIIALILNWKNPRRKNILITLVSYFIILVITSIYFVPTLLEVTQTPYADTVDETLVARSSMWETLSLVRLIILLGLAGYLLAALPKSTDKPV